MVSKQFELHNNTFRFILQPNNSLSWKGMKAVFFAVAAALGTIAGGFSLMGLWLIFPFAGLELITLAIAFYLCAHRAQRCEVITISQDDIEIFRGRRNVSPTAGETLKFHRYWARVRIEISPHTWYTNHLMIGSHGREVEVGVFLTEGERLCLAKELRKICGS